MRVLGIETSCDETAVAVVEAEAADRPVGRILANVVYSQLTEHRRFGGVVPEIAARAHLERIDGLVEQALAESGLGLGDFDGIRGGEFGDGAGERVAHQAGLDQSQLAATRAEAEEGSHGAALAYTPSGG